ncbi:epoxyqueuosine reductase QueH [Brucepastera parasyntrophica]|uniref:epoxyqueuosine reductase QueH n=1 Tax=Brucepastera parasyntrophica TaxID=2880008 RepID=UPI002108FEBC|nr:epoxyqueuosine reductase QueH [Brucepastera parasyntrophica]ULQ60578.1 epoxyqueuosine reductase QueH [Brucepastera parasyntrophica]
MKTDKPDYQKKMEAILKELEADGRTGENAPALLLHSCCAPCSSAVIAALSGFFRITVFYYNPNIDSAEEYNKRAGEQERFLALMPSVHPIGFVDALYTPEDYSEEAKAFAEEKEGGERCTFCYSIRLKKTAEMAQKLHSDFFCSTLTTSPYKDAQRVNTIGSGLEKKFGVRWLWSDFKKKGGYQRSIELSKNYGLYRQSYCGCSYSQAESERRR